MDRMNLPEKMASRRLPGNRPYGFSLIELLVVLAIVSLLTSMLLPALGRSAFSARSANCKNNLRQLALAAQLYAASFGCFPRGTGIYPSDSPDQNFSEWRHWYQYLEASMFPGREVRPHRPGDAPRPHLPRHKLLICPLLPEDNEGGAFWPFNLYGYNSEGIGSGSDRLNPSNHLLGLGGNLFGRPTPESAVLAPGDMIAFGDPFCRSPNPELDGSLPITGSLRPQRENDWNQPAPHMKRYREASFRAHRALFNRVFCDGHVETENFRSAFRDTDDYLRRWNNDNLPHREFW